MHRQNSERQLLETALKAFMASTGIPARVARTEFVEQHSSKRLRDAEIIFDLPDGAVRLSAEIKRHISRSNIGNILLQRTEFPGPFLLVTDFINDSLAEELKKRKVFFLDAAGNAYITNSQSYLFVKGNRSIPVPGKPRVPRIFKRSGLQVIFALLTNPAAQSATYREIAKISKVATGSVGWTFYDLKRLGYSQKTGRKHHRLKRKKELLEKWILGFSDVLRPAIVQGRFRTIDRKHVEDFKKTDLRDIQGYWGGEVAAEHLTGYLKPFLATIYIPGMNPAILQKLKLVPDSEGPIELLEAFWTPPAQVGDNDAPPLLVYADLVASGEARNIEAAKMIYEKYLTKTIDAD